jgi:hypothetical protein
MNKIQETDLNSILVVNKTIGDYEAQLADFPEITSLKPTLGAFIGKINGLNTIQLNGTRDKTGFKTAIRNDLNGKFERVVKAIEGSILDNPGLVSKYKAITPSDLRRARDMEVFAMVSMVVGDARALAVKIARFGITEELLTEMETLANNYNDADADKSTAAGLSSSATIDMAEIFGKINEALRLADAVVKPLEGLKPEFFKAWFEARKKQGV